MYGILFESNILVVSYQNICLTSLKEGKWISMKRIWLINCRLNLGLTRDRVAKMLKVSEPAYMAYELGIRTPRPNKSKALAELLGFDWTKFYEEE